ncbi:YesL family protein [Cytobacillus oceanisediminis]|uniref:YesL family protein n=1 Tax=Cytobacillus oceanisediminis TaxID=665099 RepID=UPI0016435864|nr:YesL family protein [Cytobacillus oceanisediminis]MBZ9537070.1 YesL family protein [Cytobacillus oceanisediminis]
MNEVKGWQVGLTKACEWIMRLLYVNLLWIGFTIIGLGVFGLFPATTAMFAVVRKWVMQENDIPIFKTFWRTYRAEFFKVNGLGVILFFIGFSIYFYLKIYHYDNQLVYLFSRPLLFVAIIYYYALVMFFFPTYVHYKLPFLHYLKAPLMFSFASPLRTFLMIIMASSVYYFLITFPGLQPFLAGSTLSLVCMFVAHKVFLKVERKKLSMEA